ncbi:unnamed protein product [Rhizophagus irregularis]|nr:unnamed protein product [Rhizophagus irregularis]
MTNYYWIIAQHSGKVLEVEGGSVHNCAQIIQHKSFPEPVHNQEWDYNYEDNSIRLRSNRKFVLDVADIRQEDATPLILYEDLCGPNQKFTLQKWNYTSGAENVDKLVTNIMDNYKFLPKLSQNLLEILNDDEYYDVTIEVVHIKLPNILPEIFEIILRYIYDFKNIVMV